MPLPWKTILTNVPWSDVLGKAPQIADSAKKMWKGMGRKSAEAAEFDPAGESIAPDADFSARLSLLEAANRKLRTQILASSELIQTLSEQNVLLVAQIENQRQRARLQAWALTATALLASLALMRAWQPRLTEFFA
uniref:Uncharacterized protein n=1 Tax=Dechloromonas aromatica (strain RCB) TaxID=159087 RepID=Q479N2_DECAR